MTLSSLVNSFCYRVQNRSCCQAAYQKSASFHTHTLPPSTHTVIHTHVTPWSLNASDTCSFIVISNLFRLTFIVHLGFICNTHTQAHTHRAHPVCCPCCGYPFSLSARLSVAVYWLTAVKLIKLTFNIIKSNKYCNCCVFLSLHLLLPLFLFLLLHLSLFHFVYLFDSI